MDKQKIIDLYYHSLRIRIVEETIADKYSEQEMRCPVHLSTGQEAIAAGVCLALDAKDIVMSGHRAHAHYLAKGGSLTRMMAEIYGKATGCSKGRGGSMHLIDLDVEFLGAAPIVGGTIPILVGTAWASRLKGDDRISVIFLGDAAVEEGVFHESLNFSALKQLPVLFVCENNFYSVNTHLNDRQPDRPLTRFAEAQDIFCAHEDGNDAVKVYKTAQKAVRNIKHGRGPAFLLFDTYRWRAHCGPTDDTDRGFRDAKELEMWKQKCPVKRLEKKLLDERIMHQGDLDTIREGIEKETKDAFQFAKESAFPAEKLSPEVMYA